MKAEGCPVVSPAPYCKSPINALCKYYIEDIQIFGMNMPFISSSEAKNFLASRDELNGIFIPKI